MVKCVRLERKKAELERKKLAAKGLLDQSYAPSRDENYVYFALKGNAATKLKTVEKELVKREEYGKPFADELKGSLAEDERKELVTSFDIVGDIATVEIPPALVKKEKLIAEADNENAPQHQGGREENRRNCRRIQDKAREGDRRRKQDAHRLPGERMRL